MPAIPKMCMNCAHGPVICAFINSILSTSAVSTSLGQVLLTSTFSPDSYLQPTLFRGCQTPRNWTLQRLCVCIYKEQTRMGLQFLLPKNPIFSSFLILCNRILRPLNFSKFLFFVLSPTKVMGWGASPMYEFSRDQINFI